MLLEQGKIDPRHEAVLIQRKLLKAIFQPPRYSLYSEHLNNSLPHYARPTETSVSIELIGLPETGKTLVLKHLQNYFQPSPTLEPIFIPEFGDLTKEYHELKALSQTLEEFSVPARGYAVSLLKLMAASQLIGVQLANIKRQAQNKSHLPQPLIVMERGPNDLIAMEMAFLHLDRHKMPPPRKLPDRARGWLSSYWKDRSLYPGTLQRLGLLGQSLALASTVDVVMPFYIPLHTVSERRIQNSQPPYTGLVDPEIWPSLEYGYAWYQDRIFPWLKRRYGLGFFSANATDEQLPQRVTNYIEDVISKRKRLRIA